MNELKQLKAAAGSGKTYALTERFLALMKGGGEDGPSLACAASPTAGYSWPEILAATFTNKAAAEMKERVVASIKRSALDIPDGQKADWPPILAERTLDRILKRYDQLGIRTIDSLLNALLRVFALDAGLAPDFDIIFDAQEPFDAAMDRIVAACAAGDPELTELYDHCLHTALRERDSRGKPVSGFKLDSRIRKHLLAICEHLIAQPISDDEITTDQKVIANLLAPSYDAFNAAGDSLRQCVEGHGLEPVSKFTKFLNRCEGLDLFDAPPSSAYVDKNSLADCVKKASKALVSPAAETCWQDFRDCHARFAVDHAILYKAYTLAPAVELARRVLALMHEEERATGCVLGSTLSGRVRRLLDSEFGVPDAFCRLGSRLHHLLIDEFQDTSRDQWGAILPLAEECLSKGGSLFYVGDVKQAIYGWRGGDATLFDEVGTASKLTHLVPEPVREKLERNWRSQGHIVRFNNDLFTRLAQADTTEALAAKVLKDAPQECTEAFGGALEIMYQDAAQELPDGKSDSGGYVRMEQLEGGSAPDIVRQSLDAAEALIADDLVHRRKLSEICVLVRKAQQATLLCDRLVARSIPVITESSLRLNLHPAVRQLASLLAIVDHPGDDMALAEFLLGDLFLKRSGLERDELLTWLTTRNPGPLHLSFRETWPDIWNRCLAPFVSKGGLMTPYDLASDGAVYFRVLDVYPDCELFLRRFLEMIHSAAQAGQGSLGSFLETWRDKGDEEKVSLPDSVDAVRIMTMHKAKGLQFPVVVVPFLFWPVPANEASLRTVTMEECKVITALSRSMGAPYHEHKRINAQEQLNLLYVAFTRAEEELYGFTPRKVHGTAPAHLALELLLELDEDNPVLELGTYQGALTKAPSPPTAAINENLPPERTMPTALPELMSWLPRLRVHRHMEETGFDARMRGEIAHRAMEYLRPPPAKDADREAASRAWLLAMQDFPLANDLDDDQRAQLEADLESMLLWALSREELRDRLAQGRSEASFLDEDGEAKRPDFLYLDETETVIFEFKTGTVRPEHADQTRQYMRLARQVFGKPARGHVVYLDEHQLVEVSEVNA